MNGTWSRVKVVVGKLARLRGYHPLSVACSIRRGVGRRGAASEPCAHQLLSQRLDYKPSGGDWSRLPRQRSEDQRALEGSAESQGHGHVPERAVPGLEPGACLKTRRAGCSLEGATGTVGSFLPLGRGAGHRALAQTSPASCQSSPGHVALSAQ